MEKRYAAHSKPILGYLDKDDERQKPGLPFGGEWLWVLADVGEVEAHALVPTEEEEGDGEEEQEKLPPGHHGTGVEDEGVEGLQHG